MEPSPVTKLIHIAITTYNRPEMLERLLSSLFTDAEKAGVDLSVHVYDDGSTDPIKADRCTVYRREENGGKYWYWALVDCAFTVAYASNWDLFYMLADDSEIVSGFFKRSLMAWKALNEKTACLVLVTDAQRTGKAQWGGPVPTLITRKQIAFWLSGWMDMSFMCGREMFTVLRTESGFVLPVSRKRWRVANSGSGVGSQITSRLRAAGWNMYHVHETLIHHGDHESRMHLHTRQINPLTA